MQQLLKIEQVCAMLQVDRSTVYNWRKHRGFPFEKVGGATRYDEDKVRRWIAENNR